MLELKVEKRDKDIKLKLLRDEGRMPAVFYGRKEKSTPISLLQSDFIKIFKKAGESTVVTLLLGDKKLSVLIHDIARNPILDEPVHVDFYAIEMDKKVEVNVTIEFEGEAPVEKELGGVIVYVMHELPIVGLPKDLPHSILVDISSLKTLEDRVLVSDMSLPGGIKSTLDAEEVVVSVTVAKEEEEEPVEFDSESIDVEQKGKGEEEGDEKDKEEGSEGKEKSKEGQKEEPKKE